MAEKPTETKASFIPARMEIPTLTIGERVFEMRLGLIEGTRLGYEDHGLFTAQLYLDYGGSSQGAGGLFLDTSGEEWSEKADLQPYSKRRRGTAYGLDWIMRVMEIVGVDEWEKLVGKRVYALTPVRDFLVRGLANVSRPEFHYLIYGDHIADFRTEDGTLR